MAVNTQAKRMNAAHAGRPWMRTRLAVGSTTTFSRAASGHAYGANGVAAATPSNLYLRFNPFTGNLDWVYIPP